MTGEYDNKRKKSANRGRRGKYAGADRENPFVNVSLSQEQETEKRNWAPDHATVFDALARAIEADYTVSIKWDEYSGGCACFLRPPDDDGPNSDLVLSGRGGTPASALREVLFVHFVVLVEEWRTAKPRTKRDFSEDDL